MWSEHICPVSTKVHLLCLIYSVIGLDFITALKLIDNMTISQEFSATELLACVLSLLRFPPSVFQNGLYASIDCHIILSFRKLNCPKTVNLNVIPKKLAQKKVQIYVQAEKKSVH